MRHLLYGGKHSDQIPAVIIWLREVRNRTAYPVGLSKHYNDPFDVESPKVIYLDNFTEKFWIRVNHDKADPIV